jgi:DNA-directed RNA polymerase subunit RPC12/RpoP
MIFTFKCPQCWRPLEVPDELIGQQVDCPDCGKTVTVAFKPPAFNPRPQRAVLPKKPHGGASFIWPLLMLALLGGMLADYIPVFLAVGGIFFALLGAIFSQLANAKK